MGLLYDIQSVTLVSQHKVETVNSYHLRSHAEKMFSENKAVFIILKTLHNMFFAN